MGLQLELEPQSCAPLTPPPAPPANASAGGQRAVHPEPLVPRPAPAREEEVPLEQLAGAELLGAEAERLAREEARLVQEEVYLHGRLAELKERRGAVKQRAARVLELVGA